jgi:hypothetical protein
MKPVRPSGLLRIPQNMSARESARALVNQFVPREFDIALLRAPGLPPSERFETMDDARARRDVEIERFENIPHLAPLADELYSCSAATPCAQVYCPVCARGFRRWFTSEALRHEVETDFTVVTVALELMTRRDLTRCDLTLVKRSAAQRFRRAAPSARVILGGIEADYRQSDDTFLVHAHLLVPLLTHHEKRALRSAFANIGVARAVRVQPLRDPVTQISYLLKFTTFHRPTLQNGPSRSAAIPLPDDALRELTLWRAEYCFLDFIFMMGLRRIGGHLVRINKLST